jgi:RimJ/RimL family protein N-acetyltransferase
MRGQASYYARVTTANESRPFFLRSARLGFGTWSPEELDLAVALWGDLRVTRLIGGPFPEDQIRDRLAGEIAMQRSAGFQYWPIFRLQDGAHVGCCGLRPDAAGAALELGVHLRFEHWGRGFASEAARAAIAHAFGPLGIRQLVAGHHPENRASRRLLERLGFRYLSDTLYPPTGLHHPTYLLRRDDVDGF